MAICTLCGGPPVDDTDIINNTCSECFEIFGFAPNGDPADMSEKIVAAANNPGSASRMTLQIDSELNSHNSTSCPSFGQFNLNNNTPANVTLIRFRDNNHNPASDRINIRMLFEFGKTGDYITLQDRDDNGTRTEIYKLTADAQMIPNCLNLTVEHVFDSGDFLLEGQIARVFFNVDVDP